MEPSPNRASPLSEPVLEAVIDYWAQTGRESEVSVRGNSMWPLVRDGDVARVAHGTGALKRGDIVAYQRNGELIVHRLIGIARGAVEPLYLIKGDNASARDPSVRASVVLGRVVAVLSAGKWRRLDTNLIQAIGWIVAILAIGRLRLSRLFR